MEDNLNNNSKNNNKNDELLSSSTSSSTSVEDLDEKGSSEGPSSSDILRSLLSLNSPNFNPSLALRVEGGDKVIVPNPEAPKYLNLFTYQKAVRSPSKEANKDLSLDKKSKNTKKDVGHGGRRPSTAPAALPSKAEDGEFKDKEMEAGPSSSSSCISYPIPGRKFLPHQLPVYQPRVEAPDVVKFMEGEARGPLGALRVAMEQKRRVRVWTRRDVGMRGCLTGFIEAFDKHWNLCLRDVDEIFYRKRMGNKLVHNDDDQEEETAVDRLKPLRPRETEERKKKASKPPSLPVSRSRRRSQRLRGKSGDRQQGSQGKGKSSSSSLLVPHRSSDLLRICRGLENLSISNSTTKSSERKHRLTRFVKHVRDSFGFVIVGVTKKVELVERHVGQLFIMGNDVVLVETEGV